MNAGDGIFVIVPGRSSRTGAVSVGMSTGVGVLGAFTEMNLFIAWAFFH